MRVKDVRALTTDQMSKKGKQHKEELFNLCFQQATDQLRNTACLRQVRENIARIKTIFSKKELNKNQLTEGSY